MSTKAIPLEEAFWFQEGPGVRKWQFTQSGVKLLNVGNILPSGKIDLSKTDRFLGTDEVEKRYKHFLVDEGDLVIASSGISFDDDGLLRTRGAFVERSQLPLCLNTSTIRFKSKKGSDIRYLRFWLDSREFRSQITRRVTGSAQQNFGPSHLEEIQITLPDLTEQCRIAAQLEQADRLRRTRRYTLELSNTLLPATFRKLFGSPREAMMRWPVRTLDDCCTRVTDGTHLTPKFESSGVPFVFVKNISNGSIDFSTDKFVSEATFHELTRCCPIEEDDVLYTIVGATYGQAVRVGRITKFTFQRHVAHIKPDRSIIEPGYLASIMQLPIVKQQADIWARGAAQPTINLKELKEFKIPVPPLLQQQHFAKLVAQHERLRATQRESLRQAEHLFQTLLHRAFATE